jgi:hypothetical protein
VVVFTLLSDNPNKQGVSRHGPRLAQAFSNQKTLIPLESPGVVMKKVIQPLAWFVVLTSVLALASGVSLGLV